MQIVLAYGESFQRLKPLVIDSPGKIIPGNILFLRASMHYPFWWRTFGMGSFMEVKWKFEVSLMPQNIDQIYMQVESRSFSEALVKFPLGRKKAK